MKCATKPFICVKDLTISYGDRIIVENVNFTVNHGDIFVIMGMSGCGKSTILRSIIGLLRPQSGKILIDGIDIWKMSDTERTEVIKTFGISYQSGALFSSMTLGENVALPLELNNMSNQDAAARVAKEKLKIVGLSDYSNFYPSQVSGGMVKRAALARALALNPRVLFFDEPTAGLDPIRSAEIDELIKKINCDTGTTVVMVTHELPTIMKIATNSVYIDAHTRTVGATGLPSKILADTHDKEVVRFLTRGQGTKRRKE